MGPLLKIYAIIWHKNVVGSKFLITLHKLLLIYYQSLLKDEQNT